MNPHIIILMMNLASIILVGFYFLAKHANRMPAGWSAITDGNDYGTTVDASGSFDFPSPPNSVHYVTKQCGSLANAKGVTMRFAIEADPGVEFLMMQLLKATETAVLGVKGVTPVLYFQRQGDDWSGAGKFETYRWWATFNELKPLAPGDYEISATFDQRWTAVMTSNAIDAAAAFKDALANADRIGFTFPGVDGFGHGVTATGKARFVLQGFEIQ